MKNPNPTPRSPSQVCNDRTYKEMKDYTPNSYYPSSGECVVKHLKSKTFWRAVYHIGDDDSDFSLNTTWEEVVPKQVIITKYIVK